MNDSVYKFVELIGSSEKSIEDAVEVAIERASKTIRNMRWFEVSEVRGTIEDGKRSVWQVTVKVGFHIEE